ncbi:MAG: hypothetical protein HC828_16625, partial [Blastochloris sp.]|nr:hypothetical protein [Blastochloris sp.]
NAGPGCAALWLTPMAQRPTIRLIQTASDGAIAGICNATGNVLGLMPHPENAILPTQHPRWTREPHRTEGDGLALFRNVVQYAGRV